MLIVLISVAIKAKRNDDLNEPVFPTNDEIGSLSTEGNTRVFFSHFAFMSLAIVCKLLFVTILLIHMTGIFNYG